MKKRGVKAQILSSDLMWKTVMPEPTYSIEERDMVLTAIADVARLLKQYGYNVIIDAAGNFRHYRDQAREKSPVF